MTLEEAALISKHPDCRPEVAMAFFKGLPHPDDVAEEAERAREEAEARAAAGQNPTASQPQRW